MVNRIDNHDPYEYPRIQNANPRGRIEAGEKFSLDYGKDTDLADKEQKAKIGQTAPDAERDRQAERDGVRLELSGQGQKTLRHAETEARDAGPAGAGKTQQPLWVSLRDTVRAVAEGIRTLLRRLWYDAPREENPEADAAAENIAEEIQDTGPAPESAEDIRQDVRESDRIAAAQEIPAPTAEELTVRMRSEEARIDREVQPYLRSGDLSQVVSLLTDNGRKTVAHNSTLLTYYDRQGNVIEPSASDRERILHGDRNARKL